MKKLVIDQYDDHQRIDKYLKKVLVQAPSSLIYKMLRKKDVKVNGKRVKENYIREMRWNYSYMKINSRNTQSL